MKKFSRILLLLMVILTMSLFSVVASASDEGVVPSSEEQAPTNVWQITHADGSVEYTDKFNSFKAFREGDVYKFLPEYYDLKLDEYASIKSDVNITIDFRGSTIVAVQEGYDDLNAQMFSISSSTQATVTLLMEDAEFHGAKQGRCVFQTGGNVIIVMDGGNRGGKIFGGSPINFNNSYSGENVWSVIKNMYLYKSTPNMQSGLGSRAKSRVRVIDSYVFSSEKHGYPVYIMGASKISLENTKVGRLGDDVAVNFNKPEAGAELIIGTGTYIYGKITGLDANTDITVHHGVHTSQNISSYVDTSKYYVSTGKVSFSETLETSASAYVMETVDKTFDFGYSVYEKYVEESADSGYNWKLEDESGNVTYCSNLTPLTVGNKKYVKVTLLKNLTVTEGILAYISRDLEIDLSAGTVSASTTDLIANLIVVRGEGKLTVKLGNKSLNIPFGLIYADNTVSVDLSATGSYAARTFVFANKGDVAVNGGSYLTSSIAFESKLGTLSLKGVTASGTALCALVYSEGDISIERSYLLSLDAKDAVSSNGKITLVDSVYIYGRVTSNEFASKDNCYFSVTPIVENSDIVIVSEESKHQITVAVIGENGVESKEKEFTFLYKTEAYVLSAAQTENSVWKVGFADGSYKYSKHLFVPFAYIEEYVSLTLLKDITLDQSFKLDLSGDFTLSFGERKITKALGYPSEAPIVNVTGMGKLTLDLSSSTVVAEGATLVFVNELRELSVVADGAFVMVGTVVNAKATPVFVKGGYFHSASGNAFVSDTEGMSFTNMTVRGDSTTPIINTTSDVTLNEGIRIISKSTLVAINTTGTVYMESGTLIAGTLKAAAVVTEGTSYFGSKPSVENMNMIVINDRFVSDMEKITYKNGTLTKTNESYQFLYRTAVLGEGIKVNLSLYTDAALNVYVPFSVTKSNKDFKVRIMIEGLLYEADANDGVKTLVDGQSFMKYTYDYVYPSLYDSNVELTLISGPFTKKMNTTVGKILENGFDLSEDESQKTSIATYCAYSIAASGHNIPMREDMKSYTVGYKTVTSDTALLDANFEYVRFNLSDNTLVLTRKEDSEVALNFYYTYGDSEINYTFEADEDVVLPIFRLEHSKPIRVSVKTADGVENVELNIHSFIAFAKPDTDARRILELYAAYLRSI